MSDIMALVTAALQFVFYAAVSFLKFGFRALFVIQKFEFLVLLVRAVSEERAAGRAPQGIRYTVVS